MEDSKQDAKDVVWQLTTPIEALSNLNWLILHEAEHGDRVRFYANLADQHLAEIRKLLLMQDDLR